LGCVRTEDPGPPHNSRARPGSRTIPIVLLLRMVQERFHRDSEGRPIRESRTPPEFLKDGEIELKQCPYAGSRYLHANPMNVSALRQMSAHWDEMIDCLGFLREAYRDARGGYRYDLMDIWRTGQMGSALPWFYILRLGETCPAFAAALSKATLGVGIWGARVLIDQFAARTFAVPGPRFTAHQIWETSEANQTLIADTEVCAASQNMMLKFYEPYVGDTPVANLGAVARLVPVRDELVRFTAHYIAFKQWIWMYWLARRWLVLELQAAVGVQDEHAEHLDPEAEPPDFFLLQPQHPTELPLEHRRVWFAQLAALVEPFCPDGSDAPHRVHAAKLAMIMSEEPADLERVALEVQQDLPACNAALRIARAASMFAQLDALHAQVIATTEAGFRGDAAAVIDPHVRDAVLRSSPRALFARYAPSLFR
jgi:hypothetical protein